MSKLLNVVLFILLVMAFRCIHKADLRYERLYEKYHNLSHVFDRDARSYKAQLQSYEREDSQ